MIKFFKQPHIIKITTIIITIVLCFNFLPSKVYAYPEKHNIENSRSKKENTKIIFKSTVPDMLNFMCKMVIIIILISLK